MQIELSDDDAATLRRLLHQKLLELETEINRTDSLTFKHELQQLARTIDRMIGQLSAPGNHEHGAGTAIT